MAKTTIKQNFKSSPFGNKKKGVAKKKLNKHENKKMYNRQGRQFMKQIVQELIKKHGWKVIAFILLLVAVKYASLEPKMVIDFLNDKSVIQSDSTNQL